MNKQLINLAIEKVNSRGCYVVNPFTLHCFQTNEIDFIKAAKKENLKVDKSGGRLFVRNEINYL